MMPRVPTPPLPFLKGRGEDAPNSYNHYEMSNEFDRSGQDQPRNANYRPELMAEANFLSGEKTMSAGSRASIQALRTTILRSVSRSFYLSIRILPAQLCEPVALAYLLARTTDTVDDTAQVS